jgi:hypothetical protein
MTLASQVPGSLHPTLDVASEVTVKWLLDGVKSGRIPETDPPTPIELANNTLRLSLEQVGGSPLSSCKPIRAPMLRRLRDGQSITIAGTIRVQLLANADHVASGWLRFGRTLLTSAPTYRLRAVSGPLIIRVQTQASTAALC